MAREDSASERVNAGQRKRYAARAARGLCTRCGKLPPEPGLKVCGSCGEKRRPADKARRARARARDKPYAGRDPVQRRRADRAGDRRRRRARREAGLCPNCGRNPPEDGRSVCEACGEAHRAAARRRYAARRSAGVCVRCGEPATGGSSRCAGHAALEAERLSPERKKAVDRKRYARRRARGVCVDCRAASLGAARCPACADRSNTRAPAWQAAQPGPPFYTVIELETGADHGTYDTEAETAACLAFLGLRVDQTRWKSSPTCRCRPHRSPACRSPSATRRPCSRDPRPHRNRRAGAGAGTRAVPRAARPRGFRALR